MGAGEAARARVLGAAFAAAVVVAGCPDAYPPPDTGPHRDGGDEVGDADPEGDDDEDGVCNATELAYGSDPTTPDTDGDGFPDLIEILYDHDPAAPSDPLRSSVALLRETPGSTVRVAVDLVVDGAGEAYSGALEPGRTRYRDGATAGSYYDGAEAVLASPQDHAAAVVPEEERFYGVAGTTLLRWELTFAFGAHDARGCAHAYPFRYTIKRDDGAYAGASRNVLLVLPVGGTLAATAWCVISDTCI